MKNKNGLVAFALVGLAAGAAAWYLLGTDDGKKQLSRANDGIKDLTRSLKDVSKREAKRARKLASQASEELHALKDKASEKFDDLTHRASDDLASLKNKAKEVGRDALDSTNHSAKKLVDQVDDAVDTAKRKVDNA
ncbi:hypothetical protein ACFX5U_01645 [Sphingobacterium sp. SG20118]|uniref:hypothetical protein n=1 Tax=Sphingobacterium TaxID=28453 RepID=UPI0004F63350|nr:MULTISPECIES: hypothetical protein [Sphingobacterium]AIM35783.1 hypothetical protein KO02_03155 [Sphingobacterium sp. ML3W]MDH5828089.1 hypothetical protein [Sphingobacterium faecium]